METFMSVGSDLVSIFLLQKTLLNIYPEHKTWVRYPELFHGALLAVLFGAYALTNYLGWNEFNRNMWLFLVILAFYSFFFLKGVFLAKFIQILLFNSVWTLLPAFFDSTADFFLPGLKADISYVLITRVMTMAALFFLSYYQKRFAVVDLSEYPRSYWLSLCASGTLNMFWGRLSFPEYFDETYGALIRFVISSFLLLINILIYYLFYRITSQYNENTELMLVNQKLTVEQRNFDEVNRLYLEMRKLRHDMLNHVNIMEGLLHEKHYDELASYFQTMTGQNYAALNSISSGNLSVDTLLNRKAFLFQEKEVQLQIHGVIPPEKRISDADLCSILSNLLDNAFEAVQQLPQKTIDLKFQQNAGYFAIVCRNPAVEDVLKQNPALESTKKRSMYHGLGLKIIHTLVDKQDGMLAISMEENLFTVKIMLPNRLTESL